MPLYGFKCGDCGEYTEQIYPVETCQEERYCSECGGKLNRVFFPPHIMGSVCHAIKQHPTNGPENLLACYKKVEERGELNLCDDKNVQDWVTDYYKHRDGWKVKSTKQEDKAMKKMGLL